MTAMDRYLRQMRFAPLGTEGQARLGKAAALVCGCGALGNLLAGFLVRAGVGRVRIVDRDFVELSNLHRQTLFDEADAAAGMPKAAAAAEKLRRANSAVEVEPVVADIHPGNIERFCEGIDAILDATDNFETRFLINDAACKLGIPWVYGGCVAAEGQTMTIVPDQTPCLRCLIPTAPTPGAAANCETHGILGPTVGVIASLQAAEAIKLLSDNVQAISTRLTVVNVWDQSFRQIDLDELREASDCPTCRHGEYPWLSGKFASQSAVLCGRNAVQLTQSQPPAELPELAKRLSQVGEVTLNAYFLRLKVDGFEITIFPDGRTIVAGTDDPAAARGALSRYVGM